MFYDLYVSLIQPFAGGKNSTNFPYLTCVLPGDTSDSQNSSFK